MSIELVQERRPHNNNVTVIFVYKILNVTIRSYHLANMVSELAIDDWARSLDSGTRTDIAIFDFSKALDSVPHKRLLVKLHSYGIRGGTLRWVESFLSCRLQRVTLSGTQSSWRTVTSGVPQGTVLGPLLFLLYINDIASDIRSELRLFADDCILYRAIKNRCDCLILQDDITKLHQWSLVWQMTFNAKNAI